MKKPTKKQVAEARFADRLYAILRNYQQGIYHDHNRSVAVGQLDAALTAVYDAIKEAAREAIGGNDER